jgi:DNA-binding NarL/FixJ family response regulator
VLVAVAGGLFNAGIAAALHKSEATVKTHVSRILTRLPLSDRVQAATLAHQAGLFWRRPVRACQPPSFRTSERR